MYFSKQPYTAGTGANAGAGKEQKKMKMENQMMPEQMVPEQLGQEQMVPEQVGQEQMGKDQMIQERLMIRDNQMMRDVQMTRDGQMAQDSQMTRNGQMAQDTQMTRNGQMTQDSQMARNGQMINDSMEPRLDMRMRNQGPSTTMPPRNMPARQFPDDALRAPQTVTDVYFTPGFLKTQIGKRIRVEFLIGSNAPMVDRTGTLQYVGASYIIIQLTGTDDLMMCDLYSIKFVTIFR